MHRDSNECSNFSTFVQGLINSVYGNLQDQMKLDLYICEALSYMHSTIETAFVGMAINYR